MNGIIILVCSLLLLMAIKLLIERNFIRLILFCVALFFFWSNSTHKAVIVHCRMIHCYKESNKVFQQDLNDKKDPQLGGPYLI